MKEERKILQINPITLQFVIWESVNKIKQILNINPVQLYQSCNNHITQYYGYYWKYLDEFINNEYYRTYNLNGKFYFNIIDFLYCNLKNYIEPCFVPLEGEEFRDIKGYEGLYQVSNFGRVINIKNKPYIKLLNPSIDFYGYFVVGLSKNNINKIEKIHRLVAKAFIPNTLNLPCINHKDEIKTNNNVFNLEWCTQKYNINYGTLIDRMSISKSNSIIQIDLETNETIKEFKSTVDVEKTLGIDHSHISSVCLGKRKSAGGFGWQRK